MRLLETPQQTASRPVLVSMAADTFQTGGIPVVDTPVLIIGSSMVGMTLSALLAKHGIRDCITVEKHSGTAVHPRAALFHPRTLLIYRELGLYDQMAAESVKYYDEHAGLHAVETLAGKKLGTWMKDINDGLEGLGPTGRMFLTQQMFEPHLRSSATAHGASLRFSTELLQFQQDSQGVTALIEDTETGVKQIIRAKYMIACDGSRSFVRRKLGIAMKGHGLLSSSLTIYFSADLSRFVKGKYNGVIYVNNPEVRGFFRLDKTGTEGFLAVNTAGEIGSEASRHPGTNITNERASEILRAAIGVDVPFEITLLSQWDAVCDVAERFQDGRVLLAGDAAHIVTPNGGFGGNTGIHDAHNLAWKLALVLQNKAGADLVDTFQQERWPVAKKTIDQVFVRYIVRTAPELKTDGLDMEEEVPEPHIELGYQYHSRGLTTSGLPDGLVISDPATAKARPGTMAHHALITTRDGEGPFPIANILGQGFLLLVGHNGIGWARAARNLNLEESVSLPAIGIHELGDSESNNKLYEKYELTPSGCVLIRPDGFVAWTERQQAVSGFGGMGMPGPEERLNCVLNDILCITPQPPAYKTEGGSMVTQKGTAKTAEASLAATIFTQRRRLEREKTEFMDQMGAIDKQLADLERMSHLQNEIAMLGMKMRFAE
ncbi:hypothetical protein LTR62_001809 [Meristemomyces frigidus]|uniref:FAD-binding domain-containing protein n=1 Tax=Meristemomyces frigidus TaxID=1508187 RepID=A0AAN7TS98_9PEZI|nr:hypothetical protein LTR62_001809 [Meristemomyces frigidus]